MNTILEEAAEVVDNGERQGDYGTLLRLLRWTVAKRRAWAATPPDDGFDGGFLSALSSVEREIKRRMAASARRSDA